VTLRAAITLWQISRHIDGPLHTAANLVTVLREGNYALRGPLAGTGGAEQLLMRELNALTAALRSQRLDETESSELLEMVMSEIDTAVLAFDAHGHVVLENQAAATLLGRAPGSLAGESLASLGLNFDLESHGLARSGAFYADYRRTRWRPIVFVRKRPVTVPCAQGAQVASQSRSPHRAGLNSRS
jgi:nitrogen fixation/metabolism regulation signal transduction histidine kinase